MAKTAEQKTLEGFVQDYSHFYSLPPAANISDLLANFPSYFFLIDEQGQLACKAAETSSSILQRLPCLNPTEAWPSEHNFRLFAFVSKEMQVYTLSELGQIQGQIALCFYGDAVKAPFFGGLETYHFRKLLSHCQPWEEGLLARAKELKFFAEEFAYCNICSATLQWLDGEYARICKNCQNTVFPRQDPSVISLITWRQGPDEWLLLAHNYRFSPHMYSLIAGFVDAGENLEQALWREAWEEAAVKLSEPRYLCSQAWPNMHSLMAGFTAQSETAPKNSHPDGKEIESLLWLERKDLYYYLNTAEPECKIKDAQSAIFSRPNVAGPTFCLPGRGTIARKLMEIWAQN